MNISNTVSAVSTTLCALALVYAVAFQPEPAKAPEVVPVSATEAQLMKDHAQQGAQIAALQQQVADMQFTHERQIGLLRDQMMLRQQQQGISPQHMAQQVALIRASSHPQPVQY